MLGDSIHALRQRVLENPEGDADRFRLAQHLMRAGEFSEAEGHFRHLLGAEPGNARYRFSLAECFLKLDRPREAVVALEVEVAPEDRSWEGWRIYVKALSASGDQETARAVYAAGLEADPAKADPVLAGLLGLGGTPEIGSKPMPVEFPADVTLSAWLERPLVTFSDVGGMEDVKEQVRRKILYPLQHPDLARQFNSRVGGGILLYGPPGCGKTYLARAVAGEVKASFISVGIHDVVDMYAGQSERNLHQLFEQARLHTPCVMFFDEADALGADRAQLKQSSSRNLVNQFLAELDGAAFSNEGILVLAATNAPWHLDAAFHRPGRFDRVLFVPPPDLAAREQILRLHLGGKPCGELDYAELAGLTEGFSGADLAGVVTEAMESALGESIKSGKLVLAQMEHLRAAVRRGAPSCRGWLASARNHALFANEGGFYDELKVYLDLP